MGRDHPARRDLLLAALALLPHRAVAGEREWRAFVAGFAGASLVRPYDVIEEDQALPGKLLYRGVESKRTAELGGHFGVWRLGPHGNDLAFRLAVAQGRPGVAAQAVAVFGVAQGQPIDQTIALPGRELTSTTVIADVLLRTRHHGRFEPYGGAGAGTERLRLDGKRAEADTDWSGLFEVLGGAGIRLSSRAAVFAEYRFLWSRHELQAGTARSESATSGQHMDFGVAFDVR
jgi:hypothetical protein